MALALPGGERAADERPDDEPTPSRRPADAGHVARREDIAGTVVTSSSSMIRGLVSAT